MLKSFVYDSEIIFLLLVIVKFIFAVLIFITYRSHKEYSSHIHWGVANILSGIGFLLIEYGDPSYPLFKILFANILFLLSSSVILIGVLILFNEPLNTKAIWMINSFHLIFSLICIINFYDIQILIIISSLSLSIINLIIGSKLWRYPTIGNFKIKTFTSIVFIAISIFHLSRIFFRLFLPFNLSLLDSTSGILYLLGGELIFTILWTNSAILMAFAFLEEKLLVANTKLEHASTHDELTQVNNRRKIINCFKYQMEVSRRTLRPFTISILDIDHFKNVNDTYGHHVGDLVLQQFAHIIEKNLRNIDFLGRYGGEEFLVILTETDLSNGVNTLERILKDCNNHQWDYADLTVTFSAGAIEVNSTNSHLSTEELISYADQLLYLAKTSGRNQVQS